MSKVLSKCYDLFIYVRNEAGRDASAAVMARRITADAAASAAAAVTVAAMCQQRKLSNVGKCGALFDFPKIHAAFFPLFTYFASQRVESWRRFPVSPDLHHHLLGCSG